MQKLLSVAIPCFNSQDYVRRAVDSLLPGRDKVEIIVVDDGSTDDTSKIAEEYTEKYPGTVRLIKKENGGHGDAVMTGLANATGLYFRVLDSDDWLDESSLLKLLDVLEEMRDPEKAADLVITNYVYEKVNEGRSHPINYRKTLPAGRLFGWDEVKMVRRFISADAFCDVPDRACQRQRHAAPQAHFLCGPPFRMLPHEAR